jgi:hypothetical protein
LEKNLGKKEETRMLGEEEIPRRAKKRKECQMTYVSCQKYEENVYRKKLLNLERQKQINISKNLRNFVVFSERFT